MLAKGILGFKSLESLKPETGFSPATVMAPDLLTNWTLGYESGTVSFRDSLVSRRQQKCWQSTVGLLQMAVGKEGGEPGVETWLIQRPTRKQFFLKHVDWSLVYTEFQPASQGHVRTRLGLQL